MTMPAAPRVLVISGSMGSGKTTILGEASDLLTANDVPHAAIDLDGISLQLLPDQLARNVHVRNLADVYKNCSGAGIMRFLVAAAIEDAQILADLKAAFRADDI